MFSQAVCERIGYYVYILKDPRDSSIFYVGKGNGNRVFQHVNGKLDNATTNDKIALIKDILSSGHQVEHHILRHGLSEELAFEIESLSIDLLGIENLTNAVKGHDSWERGLKTVDEVIQHYDAKVISIEEQCIIININKQYRRFMNPNQLYDATRTSWVLGVKRNKAKYVIAAYRGLVREIYSINSWQKVGDRWEFTGTIAPQEILDKYKNQSLSNYIKKGGQNPIRYTF